MVASELAKGRTQAQADEGANRPDFYTESFFVPEKARWDYLLNEVHHNVGDGLNKALSALEEANTALEGVVQHIDFTRKVRCGPPATRKLLAQPSGVNGDSHAHEVGSLTANRYETYAVGAVGPAGVSLATVAVFVFVFVATIMIAPVALLMMTVSLRPLTFMVVSGDERQRWLLLATPAA